MPLQAAGVARPRRPARKVKSPLPEEVPQETVTFQLLSPRPKACAVSQLEPIAVSTDLSSLPSAVEQRSEGLRHIGTGAWRKPLGIARGANEGAQRSGIDIAGGACASRAIRSANFCADMEASARQSFRWQDQTASMRQHEEGGMRQRQNDALLPQASVASIVNPQQFLERLPVRIGAQSQPGLTQRLEEDLQPQVLTMRGGTNCDQHLAASGSMGLGLLVSSSLTEAIVQSPALVAEASGSPRHDAEMAESHHAGTPGNNLHHVPLVPAEESVLASSSLPLMSDTTECAFAPEHCGSLEHKHCLGDEWEDSIADRSGNEFGFVPPLATEIGAALDASVESECLIIEPVSVPALLPCLSPAAAATSARLCGPSLCSELHVSDAQTSERNPASGESLSHTLADRSPEARRRHAEKELQAATWCSDLSRLERAVVEGKAAQVNATTLSVAERILEREVARQKAEKELEDASRALDSSRLKNALVAARNSNAAPAKVRAAEKVWQNLQHPG